MLSRSIEFFSRRSVRWLGPAALLALVPKCVLCLLAYGGMGVALGTSGPELCGGVGDAPFSWATSLAWFTTRPPKDPLLKYKMLQPASQAAGQPAWLTSSKAMIEIEDPVTLVMFGDTYRRVAK